MDAQIEYKTIRNEDIDKICILWEKLRNHHMKNSTYFKKRFSEMSFTRRKSDLLGKVVTGKLHIDIAERLPERILVGYCVSSLKENGHEKEGEIDSIYIEEECRRNGIGDTFMRLAIDWFNNEQVTIRKIVVAEGNESAYRFYERYGFYPMHHVLQQIIELPDL
jgi:diamine N-acetyltransferase